MKTKIQKTCAFLKGIAEFRESVTTHYPDSLLACYDKGREAAHKFTLRKFEES